MVELIAYGFLAPPAVLLIFCMVGMALALVWRRVGVAVVFVSVICLYIAATPIFSNQLFRCIEATLPTQNDFSEGQAIVVLGADVERGAGSQLDRLGRLTLERLTFAAEAYHELGLPIVVSGGPIPNSQEPLAELMQDTLERSFHVPVKFNEHWSTTTLENARYTAQLMSEAKITSIVLVTHAWHLPRALWSFKRVGLKAIPWPTPKTPPPEPRLKDFLPSALAFLDSFYALHEIIGGFYYRLRYL